MTLSTYALTSMNFHKMAAKEEFSVTFQSLHVYDVQGIVLPETSPPIRIEGKIADFPYSLAIGTGVNQLCLCLTGDVYADDESAWAAEQECIPPYAMIRISSPEPVRCTDAHVKEKNGEIWTYDAFPSARDDMRARESAILPRLISGLTCRCGSSDHPVRFKLLATEFFGISSDGRKVRDIRIESRLSGYVSRSIAVEEATTMAEESATFARQLNAKVARFFDLALEEDDDLKRFLYLFLAIEIETRAVFGTIDHAAQVERLLNVDSRLQTASARLFEGQRERWTNLKDQFAWCAICAWPELTDIDVGEFARLKKIRDDIAHGSIADPPSEAVVAVQGLARRVLLGRLRG